MSSDFAMRLAFAHRLADAAGDFIRPFFRKPIDVVDKQSRDFFDPVTEADKGAERVMREMIGREFPNDAILGEEYGDKPGGTGFRWVLDPVDGTRAFISGRHHWGTLIALEEKGARVLGIIDQPVLRERYVGIEGKADAIVCETRQPIKTRPCAAVAEAVVSTTHPFDYFTESETAGFQRVAKAARMSRYDGDCYAYALLAAGYADLIIESGLNPWDVAALIPVVEGAGGICTDWKGKPIPMLENGEKTSFIAAGDKRVHAEAIRLLNAS
jgi:myo-inositol-1(or 4)-monophosphatase